ncbi:MAG: hypothetical protein EOS51_24295 [Mesorhizobium sp.]|uniref:hypothetical protein n=1 Tax=unclassified Mesorhizobium TaxID=325217 RepID=UPI000FE6F2EB|nr:MULTISPECIES: hypothetical protein [unclassified Mesorhizobium]RWC09527.1 MAG: hypothetical protein EOS51_24295 [Mesorhizobium sp.]TGT93879.1 hypothetical protein EN807_26895 [Mesorhizobium sp. M5C.F.Ca.ET.164.01.1.1]
MNIQVLMASAVLTLFPISLIAQEAASGSMEIPTSSSTYDAGSTTVDSTYATTPIGDGVSVGLGSSTILNQPGIGGDGPVQGTNSGSTSDTSYGGTVIIEFD